MHTYLKHDAEGGYGDQSDFAKGERYSVGQWLINREGYHSFHTLFDVASFHEAWQAVNVLNGGNGHFEKWEYTGHR